MTKPRTIPVTLTLDRGTHTRLKRVAKLAKVPISVVVQVLLAVEVVTKGSKP